MSASFRMLWVCARGRWRIQGEKKVYIFRKTFLFLPLDAVEVTSSASAHGAGLSWEPGTIPAPALLLSQLGLAWCSSVSPELCSQGPSAHLRFCDTARTDGVSLHDTCHLAFTAWADARAGLFGVGVNVNSGCVPGLFPASVTDLGN